MSEGKTFSESWYRVANLKLCLHPHVQAQRQFFRGEKWYVLRDPFSNRFYRLTPAAYDFVSRLRPDRTVESVWEENVQLNADDAPGQEEVIQLLAQLYYANLLQYDLPPDSRKLFERYNKNRQREIQATLMSIMFARFPLIDPDRFLQTFMPLARLLISPLGAIIWLVTVGLALKTGADHFAELRQQSQGLLAPGNLPLIYAALVVIKTIHEFGHAFVCRRFGGEVHTMGVMLLLFTPLPYVDASSAWSFRGRWQRVLVGAAGMLIEVFVAAIAMFVWARTSPGPIHSVAYNIIFIASVSTILFNANPLLRFDGYYILSDLIDIPNLHGQATKQLTYLLERFGYGCKDVHPPTSNRKEALVLTGFGVASRIYRVMVFTGILLVIADRFLLAGIIMFIICAISWVLVPMGQLVRYLVTSPRLQRTRSRAILVCATAAAIVISAVGVIPFPDRFRAPGIVESENFQTVINESPGFLEAILAKPGTRVTAGAPLARLRNRELDTLLMLVREQYKETQLRYRAAVALEQADLDPLKDRLDTLRQQQEHLESQLANLTVRAGSDGLWHAPKFEERMGTYLARGTVLGTVIDTGGHRFSAVVSQKDASRLFQERIRRTEVRIPGEAHRLLVSSHHEVIAAEQHMLPSAALGWRGGGPILVAQDDPSGQRTAEPFFLVRASLQQRDGLKLLHGRRGKARFAFRPRPLIFQWYRRFRQMLQQRYGF